MAEKLDYEFVKKCFSERGLILLSEEYQNAFSPLRYKCRCGTIAFVALANLRRGQKFCQNCNPKKKVDISEVEELVAKYGCALIEYTTASHPLWYKCKCGSVCRTTLSNFKRSNSCRKCSFKKEGKRRRISQQYIEEFLKAHGCILLSQYVNNKTKIKFKCSCGREAETLFRLFKDGVRCRECFVKKISGEHHPRWNPMVSDRRRFISRCHKSLRRALTARKQKTKLLVEKELGYTCEQLRCHLGWSDGGKFGYMIDHCFPIKAFLDYNIYDLSIVNALDNLRLIKKRENLRKNSRYDKEEFSKWLSLKKKMT